MGGSESAKNKYDSYRQNWLISDDGVRDGLGSVFEIFSLIENHLARNAGTTEMLEVKLDNKNNFLRFISSQNFCCQIELTRFLKYSHNHLINLRLEIILFSKIHTLENDCFNRNYISCFSLKADLTPDNQVVWRDQGNISKKLSAEDICEMIFSLLLNQIK